MKKLLIILATLALIASVGVMKAEAALTDTIAVTVTIQSLSVSITEPSYDFGVVTAGSETVSASSATVTNDGNVTETYALKLANPASWTAVSTVPAAEQYRLEAMFNSAAPLPADFNDTNDYILTSDTTCSATKFAGNETGLSVLKTEVRHLWFQFEAPSSTAVTTQQSITVTVTAAAG